MKYIVDIDGTICTNTEGDYQFAEPYKKRIVQLNRLFDEGHEIHYWTARGSGTDKDWTALTYQQLKDWECKYTTIQLGKPSYDVWIDDKSFHPYEFFD